MTCTAIFCWSGRLFRASRSRIVEAPTRTSMYSAASPPAGEQHSGRYQTGRSLATNGKWMKELRVWQANDKVFSYPEHYII